MRIALRLIVSAAVLWTGVVAAGAPEDPAAAGRQIAMDFGSRLKTALGGAMAEDGPNAAVDVCHTRAPAIAEAVSEESGADVGRTALKVRNPENAPDADERSVLEAFARQLSRDSDTVPEKVMRLDDGRVRYMRAIVTQPLCLTCHGSQLSPAVTEVIDARYPEDQARGFSVGELRGAFTITWPAD
ncbi:MAG: DUF3365 domain-containing protein [Gammaproteobacteria bacterium]